MEHKPVVDDSLNLGKEFVDSFRTTLLPNDVDDASACVANLTLGHLSAEYFAILNEDIFVLGTSPIPLLSILDESYELDFG
jgi:hypothetical protein